MIAAGTTQAEDLRLLPMRRKHLSRIVAIEGLSASHPWSRAAFARELVEPQARWVVAEREGVILGFGGIRCIAGEAQLYELAVHPAARRDGVGRALMTALLARAERAGCARMTLEVAQDNMAAIQLYTSAGFRRVGLRKDFYATGCDALLMERP